MAGKLTQDSTDSTFSTAPPPAAASWGANARVTASVPKKCVSSSSLMSSSEPSSRPAPVADPALLISRLTSPVASAAAATDAGSVMSSAIGVTPARSTDSGLRAPA